MATKKQPRITSPKAVVPAEKQKVIRKTSESTFERIENKFNSVTTEYMNVKKDIQKLESELKSRKLFLSVNETTQVPVFGRKLNSYEIALRRKQLAEKKTELKSLKHKLNSAGVSLRTASKRSEEAAKHQSKKITIKVELSRQALKELDKIKEVVNSFIDSMRKSNDARISTLKALATTNGRRFYSDIQKIFRNAEFQADVKAMIAASAPVRTELSNMIRTSFGWSKPTK